MSRRRHASKAAITKAVAVDYGGGDPMVAAISNRFRGEDAAIYYMLYATNTWVRAVVNMIAESVGSEGYTIAMQDGDPGDGRIEKLTQLFGQLFVGESERGTRTATAIDLKVFGRGFWHKKYAGRTLVGIERLDPRLVSVKLSSDRKQIQSYVLRPASSLSFNGAPVDSLGAGEIIPPDEMVMFRYPGGDKIFGTGSPLDSLDLTLAIDLYVRRHRAAYFENGATPGTTLINKNANADQINAAVKQIRDRAGSKKAYLPMILSGEWDVVQLAQSGKQEVDFVKGTGITREDICATYAFPLGKLLFAGNALGSSGKDADDDTFQEQCVLPTEELLYQTITDQVLHADFADTEDLQLVPKRRNRLRFNLIAAAESMVKIGATGNEARELIGLSKVNDPGMDVPLFIGATGAGIVSDEITPQNEPQPNLPEPDEVGENAAKGKAWYPQVPLRMNTSQKSKSAPRT